MFGVYELQMPSSIQNKLAGVSGKQKRGTTIGAFIMGGLSSLIVTACVAPVLIAALMVIAQTGDLVRGGTGLFAMSLGMGAPLLVVGAAQGKFLPKAGPWMIAVRNAFGFMMLGLAIWMLSRILPGEVTMLLWALLIFMAGVFMGGLTTLTTESSTHQKLGKGISFLAIIYGIVLLLGFPWSTAVTVSAALAQIGEFSLILVQVGEDVGLSPADAGTDGRQFFIATAVLLIAATPVLFNLATKMGTRVWNRVEGIEDAVAVRMLEHQIVPPIQLPASAPKPRQESSGSQPCTMM